MRDLSIHVLRLSGNAEPVAEQFADAGYTVSGPAGAPQLIDAVRQAPGADVVVVIGGTTPWGAFTHLVGNPLFLSIPGVGNQIRTSMASVMGITSALHTCEAGLVEGTLVIGLPEHEDAAQCAVAQVVLPLLPLAFAPTTSGEPAERFASDSTQTSEPALVEEPPEGIVGPSVPVSADGMSVGMTHEVEERPPEVEHEVPSRGWRAAVAALEADVQLGRREELPEPIEKLAPVVNVLHTAGEFGTMRLPNGRRYGLYGWPDLRRDGSKVLAVSWGDPLAEIVALHRHPAQVGTLIDGDKGLLPSSSHAIDPLAEQATGSVPPHLEGAVFALDSDAVYVRSGRRVERWDGQKLRDDGNLKQVLSSLTLRWSSR